MAQSPDVVPAAVDVAVTNPHATGEAIIAAWTRQAEFQEKVFPGARCPERIHGVMRELSLCLVSEVQEALRETGWKTHRSEPKASKSRSNLLEELVDQLKYWMAISQLHGFSLVDVLKEFDRKSRVVEQRWRQERELVVDPKRAVVVDVDQTLADYVGGWLDFAERRWGCPLCRDRLRSMDLCQETCDQLGITIAEAIEAKHDFREDGRKLGLLPLPGAAEMMQRLRSAGAQLLVLTARPYDTYKRVFADTMLWLTDHRIPYDAVWMAEDKREFLLRNLPQAVAVIDDDPGTAMRLARAGYAVFAPAGPHNVDVGAPAFRLPLADISDRVHQLLKEA